MAFLKWTAALSVGVGQFDEQHKVLIGLFNDLHSAMMEGRGNDALGGIIGGLVSYTETHFADEERLMQAHGYPGLAHHRDEHQQLIQQVQVLRVKLGERRVALTVEVMAFLKDWLVNHIQLVDREYSTFFRARGIA